MKFFYVKPRIIGKIILCISYKNDHYYSEELIGSFKRNYVLISFKTCVKLA